MATFVLAEAGMALGISNLIIGAVMLASGLWQRAQPGGSAALLTALVVAGSGAISIGVYQLWRQRYVYQ